MSDLADKKCKAEEQDPVNPVFASNLSAALFEIADYEGCFRAIVRSWTALSAAKNERVNETLALRLSTRLAKTMVNGLVTGALSDAMGEIEGGPQAVASLREQPDICIDTSADARTQASKAWQDWDTVFAESLRVGDAEKRRAQINFARLPVTKQYLCALASRTVVMVILTQVNTAKVLSWSTLWSVNLKLSHCRSLA